MTQRCMTQHYKGLIAPTTTMTVWLAGFAWIFLRFG